MTTLQRVALKSSYNPKTKSYDIVGHVVEVISLPETVINEVDGKQVPQTRIVQIYSVAWDATTEDPNKQPPARLSYDVRELVHLGFPQLELSEMILDKLAQISDALSEDDTDEDDEDGDEVEEEGDAEETPAPETT